MNKTNRTKPTGYSWRQANQNRIANPKRTGQWIAPTKMSKSSTDQTSNVLFTQEKSQELAMFEVWQDQSGHHLTVPTWEALLLLQNRPLVTRLILKPLVVITLLFLKLIIWVAGFRAERSISTQSISKVTYDGDSDTTLSEEEELTGADNEAKGVESETI